MGNTIQFLLQHGYMFLFLFVLAEQLGLPLSAVPVLLAVGALAGHGRFSILVALLVAGIATLFADLFWFYLGRKQGAAVTRLLCRISLEPDSCVRRMDGVYDRYGACALVLAKFVPGLSLIAPPLAGNAGLPVWRFLACDGFGTLLWSGTFLGSGYVFDEQIEELAERVLRFGWYVLLILGLPLAAWIGWKYLQRRRFLHKIRTERITPDELLAKMENGEKLVLVDLRDSREVLQDGAVLPGALQLSPEELETRHGEIPRDRDVILYCA